MTEHEHDWVVRRVGRAENVECFTCGERKPQELTHVEGCPVCKEALTNTERTGLAYRCPAHT